MGVRMVAWRHEDTYLQVSYSHVPLPQLFPQGLEFRGHPSGWPQLGFQGLNDLGIRKKKLQETELDFNDSDFLKSWGLIEFKASHRLGNIILIPALFCFV